MYQDFVTEKINPATGFSHFLDEDYYTSEPQYINMMASAVGKNKIANEVQPQVMILKAYGLSHGQLLDILCVYKPALKEVNKKAIKSLITRWCRYFSYHLKDLKRLIGDNWQVKAEQLIDFYIKNKDNPSVANSYLNQPVSIDSCIDDIRSLLEKLLLITQLEIPIEHNPKHLYNEEQEVKKKINNCEDIELLSDYYAELISILGKKNENRNNFSKAEKYKAIRILKTCGFIEAAHKWLNCFPKK